MVTNLAAVPETATDHMEIILVGLNHKTASVDLRECMAFTQNEVEEGLAVLRRDPLIKEAMLFSTCNRMELLFTTEAGGKAVDAAKAFLAGFKRVPVDRFEKALYVHRGDEAVRHLYRVAASLDSMVVGEPQILGQIKQAYRTAAEKKSAGVILNRLLHKTFTVAKRIRTETGIGGSAVSISYAAIELGRKIFGDLEGKKVLLVGAGEMAELAVEHLIRHKVGEIFVANRTFENGVTLAGRFGGSAIRFEEIPENLSVVDIIISSTGSPDYVIRKADVKGALKKRKNRSLFFIDIAVPRDIDPGINRLSDSYVYDIDDLKGVIDENKEERNREAVKGERIVDEAVIRFGQWMEGLKVVPTIVDMKRKMERIAGQELERTLQDLDHLSERDQMALRRMTGALVNKILHDPILFLKNTGCHRDDSFYLNAARMLFRLDD